MNRKILMSFGAIVFVTALSLGATGAFFSDVETSSGNTFTAGSIDLKIDNESYVTDLNGRLVASPSTSWELNDLTGQLFFNFNDVKPGDVGEDTISLHVKDNNAWICAATRVTDDNDSTYSEPELADDLTVSTSSPATTDGELAENLEFAFWADDGDNVLETDEVAKIFAAGTVSSLNTQGQIALADSQNNVWANATGTPVSALATLYVGKAWCFGDLSANAVSQDGQGKTGTNGPLQRGTGVSCNGASSLNNAAQTDVVKGDLEFYAVQSRNNAEFQCSKDYTPSWNRDTAN